MRRAALTLVVLLVALTGTLAALNVGCTRTAEKEAEKRVNAVLPRYIAPANRWETKVEGDSAGAVMRGRLRRVHVVGTGVKIYPGFTLEQLTLDFDEVSVNTKEQRLESVGSATFAAQIRDVVLDRYLRVNRRDINNLSLRFEGSDIVVHADPDNLKIITVPVTVSGRLVPRGNAILDFEPDQAKVSILPIPQVALDYLAKKLNPAVDLSHLVVPLRIRRADVSGYLLTVTGSVAPEDVLKLAQ